MDLLDSSALVGFLGVVASSLLTGAQVAMQPIIMALVVITVSLLIGIVLAVEAVLIVSILTLPALAALTSRLPWRREADRRAETLLREILTPGEFARFLQRGYLDVPSPSRPDRVYRIPRRRGTVDVYERDRFHSTLCIGPILALPDADVVVAHRLTILADEPRYLATANLVRGSRWEEPAAVQDPPGVVGRWPLITWVVGAAVMSLFVIGALHVAGLAPARDAVLAVVLGWPLLIVLVSLLGAVAVMIMHIAARPMSSDMTGRRRGP